VNIAGWLIQSVTSEIGVRNNLRHVVDTTTAALWAKPVN